MVECWRWWISIALVEDVRAVALQQRVQCGALAGEGRAAQTHAIARRQTLECGAQRHARTLGARGRDRLLPAVQMPVRLPVRVPTNTDIARLAHHFALQSRECLRRRFDWSRIARVGN